jgi:hypothetical protein
MLKADLSSLRETKPHEYVMRFVFGGICTVLAGLIAKRFGPVIGGLFLAFPAIFPAGASLIEDHEKKRKAEYGFDGTIRGRMAASVDAAGASLGCIGLVAFAIVLWHWLPVHNAYWVISCATLVWMGLSASLWALRRKRFFHCRPRS